MVRYPTIFDNPSASFQGALPLQCTVYVLFKGRSDVYSLLPNAVRQLRLSKEMWYAFYNNKAAAGMKSVYSMAIVDTDKLSGHLPHSLTFEAIFSAPCSIF